MKLQVMAIYDAKARAFLLPFYVSRTEVGMRSFSDAVMDRSQQIGRNPDDFTLFHLGTWDDEKSVFDVLSPMVNLGLGSQFTKDVPANVQR